MYLNLHEALTDWDISLAFKRLHNSLKLAEVNAPAEVVDRAFTLLDKSKSELGDRFSVVEKFYPEYKVRAEEEYRRENEWQSKCFSCTHWGPFEDENEDTWCNKFTIDDRSYPAPCADYLEEVDGEMK